MVSKNRDDLCENQPSSSCAVDVKKVSKSHEDLCDNQPSSSRTAVLTVNRDLIKSEPTTEGDLAVLSHTNVSVYDSSVLEEGIITQARILMKSGESLNDKMESVQSCGIQLRGIIDPQFPESAHSGCLAHSEVQDEKNLKSNNIHDDDLNVDTDCGTGERDELKNVECSEGSEYAPSSNDGSSSDEYKFDKGDTNDGIIRPLRSTKSRKADRKKSLRKLKDDADDEVYEKRIKNVSYLANREILKLEGDEVYEENAYHELHGGLKVPLDCWNRLYKFQKTGVKWLNELHEQSVGGILADEMGLGKTVQMISFLRAVAYTQLESRDFSYRGLGPVLIVCPTTLIHQWLKELHTWFPLCRVVVLHSSGTYRGSLSRVLMKVVMPRRNGSVLITSYTTFAKKRKSLSKAEWHYVILDEGHKIRNPGTQTTMAIKEVRTPHRIILTGSPLQNSLKELWSLIDFVYPGRLGDLQSFTEKFSIPITQGGYANASVIQVRTAYKCACVLRDAISPYLLRRMKKDVKMTLNLPSKTEQVLFCDLTSFQRKLYKDYLSSRECGRILSGCIDAFAGLITLRKLCNHPDLITGGPRNHGDHDLADEKETGFGAVSRSGKMEVLKALLELWHRQNQRVLVFSQSRQMLRILEKFVVCEG